jgi:hypothetical protein
MSYHRHKQRCIITWLLLLAVAQRAFIAPGYMPGNPTGDDFPITITMCNGDGVYAGLLARLQNQTDSPGTEHKQATAVCGLLTGSINLLSNTTLFNDFLLRAPVSEEPGDYDYPAVARSYPHTHPSRAPPVSSAIQQ